MLARKRSPKVTTAGGMLTTRDVGVRHGVDDAEGERDDGRR